MDKDDINSPEAVERDAIAAEELAERIWDILDGRSLILQCTTIQVLIMQLIEFPTDEADRDHLRSRLMHAIEPGHGL